jgi:hypothetical protein
LYAVDTRVARRRRLRLYAGGAVAVIAILGAGIGARLLLGEEAPAAAPATAAAPAVPATAAAAAATAAPEAPAVVTLDIKPNGEVSIDGVLKGKTPPLTEFELKAGKHAISVRSGNHPPLETEVNLAPGERITLTHRFGSGQRAAQRSSAPRPEPSVSDKVNNTVQRWRRKVGI